MPKARRNAQADAQTPKLDEAPVQSVRGAGNNADSLKALRQELAKLQSQSLALVDSQRAILETSQRNYTLLQSQLFALHSLLLKLPQFSAASVPDSDAQAQAKALLRQMVDDVARQMPLTDELLKLIALQAPGMEANFDERDRKLKAMEKAFQGKHRRRLATLLSEAENEGKMDG